jgi:hypothetical protein
MLATVPPLYSQITAADREAFEAAGWIAGSLLLENKPDVPPEEPVEAPEETTDDMKTDRASEIEEPVAEAVSEPQFPIDFAKRPRTFLHDAQGLLSPGDKRDRLKFLDYHAGDSAVDLYVHLFDKGQSIPDPEVHAAVLDEAFHDGKPAVVLVYFMGEPQRALLHLSPGLKGRIAPRECKRALESAMLQAMEKNEPSAQLEAFLVQMSIRIYWLERLLGGEKESPEDQPIEVPAKVKITDSLMTQVQPWIDGFLANLKWIGLGISACISTLLASLWWVRNRQHRFPELDVEPRLGGAHGAGIGAVISFTNSQVPPMAQRNQTPDYLPR